MSSRDIITLLLLLSLRYLSCGTVKLLDSIFTLKVKWRPVIWGFGLQFVFGLLILRTSPGRSFFKWLGDRVTLFLAFSDSGAKFIFGDLVSNRYFAFKVSMCLSKFDLQPSIAL